jgi:hypothetical protein
MNDTMKRGLKGGVLWVLIVLAIVGGVVALASGLGYLKDRSCDRLNAARIAHLMPGHLQPGPGSIYVKGIGTDQSEILDYLEAEAEWKRAGCSL